MTPAPDDTACVEIVETVTAYLEGALDDDDRRAFDAHLALCEGCEAYVGQVRAAIAALGGVGPDDLPAGLRDGLLAAFRDWRGG